MLEYLHILIRVEDDGSLHALGAFTSKEKQTEYQRATGLKDSQVRLDFFNGPFEADIRVVYAGHRRWNMDRFQLAGYFLSEGEAWTWVTQEGYVSVLRIDTTYEAEQALEREALERYRQLQKRWRLSSYDEIVAREGADKARANIMLRFYEDALESFRPKTSRDIRALYAFVVLILFLPLAVFFFLSQKPEYGENVDSVGWLPDYASRVSYYRSDSVNVFEFDASPPEFKRWAESRGMAVRQLLREEILSRYKAYLPAEANDGETPAPADGRVTPDDFRKWQEAISVTLDHGWIARLRDNITAVYDPEKGRAYYEELGSR